MRILLDGDACPVKAEAISLADKWDLPVIIVASYNHVSKTDYPAHVQTVYVERGADQADYKIVALVQQGDIVVTQDYGLATILLNKAIVLHHMGWRYRPEAMDQLLTQRYMGQVSRRKTGRYGGKGPKPFGRQDRERFSASLEAIIRQEKQEEKGAGL